MEEVRCWRRPNGNIVCVGFFRGSTGYHTASIELTPDGKEVVGKCCSCIGFMVRKKCRHVELLRSRATGNLGRWLGMAFEIDDFLEKKLKSIASSVKAVNELFDGAPYSNDVVFALYGKPQVGKTLLMIQEAAWFESQGLNVLYVDTEGSLRSLAKQWLPIFRSRFEGKKKGKIYAVSKKTLETLCEFLGKRVSLIAKGKEDSPKIEFNVIEDVRSELEEVVRSKKIDVVIVDSVTAPVREAIPSAQQNNPAKADATSLIMGRLVLLQERYDVAVLTVHHACNDEGTMVVVRGKGIVPYTEVEVGDEVLGLNENGEVVWTRVLEKFVYDFDGELVYLRGKSASEMVTDDHRVMVVPKVGRPSKKKLVGESYVLAKDVPKSGVLVPKAARETVFMTVEEAVEKYPLAFLVGLWVAEGDRTARGELRFSLSEEDMAVAEKALRNAGVGYRVHRWGSDKSRYVIVRKTEHAGLMDLIGDAPCGARNKRMPESVWRMGKEERLAVLLGYLFGDGHRVSDKHYMFTTVSDALVTDLIALATGVGWAVRAVKKEATYRGLGRVKAGVGYVWVGSVRAVNRAHVYPRRVRYRGKVWSLMTETGNYAIWREGFITFTGNSFNPANPWDTQARMRGGVAVHHYCKHIVYVDYRDAKEWKDYRRFWLVRSPSDPPWSRVAIAKLTDVGYVDADVRLESALTKSEYQRLRR